VTPEELADIKDALPLAQSRVRCMLETDRGNLAMMGARWTAEDVQPVIDAASVLVAEVERLRTLVQRLLDAPNYAPLSGVPYAYSAPMDEITCAWCGEWPGRPHEADCPWLEAERLGLTHHVTA
jgi:hypothetical protein